jgi:hypothetical protein
VGKITLTLTCPADAYTPAAEARDRIEAAAMLCGSTANL